MQGCNLPAGAIYGAEALSVGWGAGQRGTDAASAGNGCRDAACQLGLSLCAGMQASGERMQPASGCYSLSSISLFMQRSIILLNLPAINWS